MSLENDEDLEDYPIAYSIDNLILMHRDAHFGGNFAVMLDYYQKEGKGVSREFDLPRIQELYELEQKTGKNLSAIMLSGTEAEKVSRSRQLYKELRSLYEISSPKNKLPRLIADLILCEENETNETLKNVVAEKDAIVPFLIELLRSEEFYDPLFPGYGLAPALAAKSLGVIGDKRAIIALFESIGQGDFFNEDIILNALSEIGKPAKEFLLKVLHGHPITSDNEQAAIALLRFKDDPEVSDACFKLIQELDLKKQFSLATYLILACEGLTQESQHVKLLSIAKNPSTPKTIQQDILAISKTWKKPEKI